jgi:aryl-alcohol dehydrogenase-like predicted oxidoreductase
VDSISISGLPFPASRIGLGTRAIGGWKLGGTDTWDAVRTIQEALDQGINLIDTAPVYGFGRSEELVGQALMPRGRRALSSARPERPLDAGLELDSAHRPNG